MKSKWSSLILVLCSLLLIFGLVACDLTANQTSTTNDTGQTEATTVSATKQALDESIFPKDKVVDVKITIDPDDFQDMLDNASAEEYKTASVNYNGIQMNNIGIRTKGNLSLRSVVQMTDSDRYSFKLSFDEYVDQTLEGISKINLNNNYSDATSMREFLTYELAETMGLPTPKYSYVNIYINDELWGFYLAIEQIGDAYLNRHFGNAYGALYKGVMTGQGSELSYLGDDASLYTGLELKSDTTNNDILLDMLNELNNGSDYAKYIDVEEALSYIALNVVTNNSDSYMGNNKQNYYLYENNSVFNVLPWDYNMAFGGMGGGMGGFGGNRNTENTDTTTTTPSELNNPSPTDADKNSPNGEASTLTNENSSSSNYLMIDEPTDTAVSERPLIAKLLAVDEYKELYHSIIQKAVEGYLSNDTFTARVQEIKAMIADYVKADPNAFYTYNEFEQAVPKLITTNASQVTSISSQLDGTLPSSGDGSGSGTGMGRRGSTQAMAVPTTTGTATDSVQPNDSSQTNTQNQQQMQSPPDFEGGEGGRGQMGEGFSPPDGGGGMRGGMGGGGMGGMGGFGQQPSESEGSITNAITAGIAILILLLAALFINLFRRKKL